MSVVLKLSPHDPIIARDGRPFGAGQGNRMRGLPWPLPSVVAGSFRTALVKSIQGLDFSGDAPERLMQIAVAGVFPVHDGQLYLPAPSDALAEPDEAGSGIKKVHRVVPQSIEGGCDMPEDGLQPVMLSLSQAVEDFKPADVPAWWPLNKYSEWLQGRELGFDETFLCQPIQETRDHVRLDADLGAAAEGQIFASANLNVTHLPRYGGQPKQHSVEESKFHKRLAPISLTARVTVPESERSLSIGQQFSIWHPLGGERRMVHWGRQSPGDDSKTIGWECPEQTRLALSTATKIRMVLATPAIFKHGWKPGWLTDGLEGELSGVKLRLVGVSNGRWKAVSGWLLADIKNQKRGPKPIRRMVPAGSVYFFKVDKPGDAARLADLWLASVCDDEQEQRDGFGLAVWGIWNDKEKT